MKTPSESKGIYTIGHSVHGLIRFIDLLKQYHIEAVADVRSMPYSRWQPHFNREDLSNALKGQGIFYVFLGRELGARTDDPTCYENGRVQYRRLARTKLFRSGIQRVIDGSEKMNIALMCAEKDPLDCHRSILISRAIVDHKKDVNHILENGEIESHQALMKRLQNDPALSKELSQSDMFMNMRNDDKAYLFQERKIVYVDKEHASKNMQLKHIEMHMKMQ